MIRNKIEKVRITLRRAIVVLVHAHVTLDQALSAVDAEEIVGVVTLPCCNWFSKQELLFGRHPDLVYDDFSILSDKREVRLWVNGPQASHDGEGIVISDAEVKVCIRKTFRAGKARAEDEDDEESAVVGAKSVTETRDPSAKVAAEAKYAKVFNIFKELLSTAQQIDGSSQDELPLPVELTHRLTPEMHTLILDSRGAKAVASRLLRDRKQRHVYVLGEPREVLTENALIVEDDNEAFQQEAMTIPLLKLKLASGAECDISEEPQGSFRIATKELTAEVLENEDDDTTSGVSVTFEASASSSDFERFDCVVDHRFLYHGFRGESRNAALFRKLCSLVHSITTAARRETALETETQDTSKPLSLICVTPRKNWRKKDYLSHEALQFEVQAVPVKQRMPTSWDLKDRSKRDQELTFIYWCTKIHRGDADRRLAKQELESQQSIKDAVLAMKQTLQLDFDTALEALVTSGSRSSGSLVRGPVQELSVQEVIELAPQAAEIDPSVVVDRTYVQVLGQISNVRRYTKGMAFLSLEPPQLTLASDDDTEANVGTFIPRNPLQAFLQLQELQWSPELFKDVLLMLHAGDQVRVLGFLKKSERGTPLLSVAAISFVRGEFQAYA